MSQTQERILTDDERESFENLRESDDPELACIADKLLQSFEREERT